jgi:hypothetical protein
MASEHDSRQYERRRFRFVFCFFVTFALPQGLEMGAGAGKTRVLSSRAPDHVSIISTSFSTGLERVPGSQK